MLNSGDLHYGDLRRVLSSCVHRASSVQELPRPFLSELCADLNHRMVVRLSTRIVRCCTAAPAPTIMR